MQYLERLEKWIVSALAEKPVGEPVAVRAFYHITSDHGLLLPVLAEATSMDGMEGTPDSLDLTDLIDVR